MGGVMIGIDTIGKKAASIASILILTGLVVGFLDVRHAKAGDVNAISNRMDRRDIFDTEDKIEEVALKIARLDGIPVLDKVQMYELSILIERKAKLLRRLKHYQEPSEGTL